MPFNQQLVDAHHRYKAQLLQSIELMRKKPSLSELSKAFANMVHSSDEHTQNIIDNALLSANREIINTTVIINKIIETEQKKESEASNDD